MLALQVKVLIPFVVRHYQLIDDVPIGCVSSKTTSLDLQNSIVTNTVKFTVLLTHDPLQLSMVRTVDRPGSMVNGILLCIGINSASTGLDVHLTQIIWPSDRLHLRFEYLEGWRH